MHYLLIYEVVPDYVERRAPLRAAHLAHAWASADRGELVLGGALQNHKAAPVAMGVGMAASFAAGSGVSMAEAKG